VQAAVLRLHRRRLDALNWRPNVVVFGGPPAERTHLVRLARWLFQGRGLSTYYYVMEGSLVADHARARQLEPIARDVVSRIDPRMLTRVAVARDVYEGIRHVAQSYGLSGMEPNTLLLGWGGDGHRPADFANMVRDVLALDQNLLLLRHDPERSFGLRRRIDVWWGGQERNGALMLLLAWFLTCSEEWTEATVRIHVVVDDPGGAAQARENLARVIQDARVRAEANVIRRDPALTIREHITRESGAADLVLMGLRPPDEGGEDGFTTHVNELMAGLRSVLLVRAATRFDGAALLFDDG
jgi:hypothetical protein